MPCDAKSVTTKYLDFRDTHTVSGFWSMLRQEEFLAAFTPEEYALLILLPSLPHFDRFYKKKSTLDLLLAEPPLCVVLAIWLPVSAYLISTAQNKDTNLASAAIGFMFWYLLEYSYHRFLGHMPVVNKVTQRLQFEVHGGHHFAPRDTGLLTPPVIVLFFAIALSALFSINDVLNARLATGVLMLQYLIFDTLHYAIHRYPIDDVKRIPAIGPLFSKLWANHKRHHLFPTESFFVTSGGFFAEVGKKCRALVSAPVALDAAEAKGVV